MKHNLNLRFSMNELLKYSEEYVYGEDSQVLAVGKAARSRGWLSLDELAIIGRWKSPRIIAHIQKNKSSDVELITRLAFEVESESARVGVLQPLHGVGLPVASTLLHLCHADSYPIIDFRALWSLGYENKPPYSLGLWFEYVETCRKIARKSGLGMRTVDRALWQYSNEHQG